MSFWDMIRNAKVGKDLEAAIEAYRRRYIRSAAAPEEATLDDVIRHSFEMEQRARHPQRMDFGPHADEERLYRGQQASAEMFADITHSMDNLPAGKVPDYVKENHDLYAQLEQEMMARELMMDIDYGKHFIGPKGKVKIPPSLNAMAPLLGIGHPRSRELYDRMLSESEKAAKLRAESSSRRAIETMLYAADLPGNLMFDLVGGAMTQLPEHEPAAAYSTSSLRK